MGWPLNKDIRSHLGSRVQNKISLQGKVNSSRYGNPKDIANAVLFLASPASTLIAGITLMLTADGQRHKMAGVQWVAFDTGHLLKFVGYEK